MPADPYDILGIARDATPEQVRAAYRTLAKRHHPDLNPGDRAAEDRFKAINAANDLLADPERRARFDRGEIDAAGQEQPERQFWRTHAGGPGGARYRPGTPPDEDPAFADIFAEMLRRGAGERGRPSGPLRGEDRHYTLAIDLADAARGGLQRLTLPDGRTLDVAIPVGTDEGQVLRLRGQGGPGWNGGAAGDALIEIALRPHPVLRRKAADLHIDLPVTVADAVLGAKVPVPTLSGFVTLTVPPHSDAGRTLRLRGQGMPAAGERAAGDLYVHLALVTGAPDAELEAALAAWRERHAHDPRPQPKEAA